MAAVKPDDTWVENPMSTTVFSGITRPAKSMPTAYKFAFSEIKMTAITPTITQSWMTFNVVIVSLYLSLYLFAILFLTTQVQSWITSSGWWWRCLILSQCTSCRPTFLHGWISSLSTTDSDMTIGLFQIWTAILKSECIVISDSGIGTLTFTSPKYNTYCVRQAL